MRVLVKAIKGFLSWLKEAIIETINQLFTLLGFFTAWICLTDTAQTVTGWATIIVFVIWISTMWLRKED